MDVIPAPTGWLDRVPRPRLAYRYIAPTRATAPTVLFLPGYASDMAGSKATALFDWARSKGMGCLLFDYAGCGQSGGIFAEQTLTGWRDDALAMLDWLPTGPVILVGSSMGGWIMLLVALARADRIAALLGIAAAPDFTQWSYDAAEKATLARDRRLLQPNPYGPEPTLTTQALWQSGQDNLLLDGPIAIDCPVTLLHGQNDGDVPPAIGLQLAERLRSADVVTLLVKGGDHRLSRPQDIALLITSISALIDRLELCS